MEQARKALLRKTKLPVELNGNSDLRVLLFECKSLFAFQVRERQQRFDNLRFCIDAFQTTTLGSIEQILRARIDDELLFFWSPPRALPMFRAIALDVFRRARFGVFLLLL